jgi:hypothetical protein
MRNKMRNLVSRWASVGLVVEVELSTGTVLRGRVEEIDGDELILEPIEDGQFAALIVIAMPHVVSVRYTDDEMPSASSDTEPDLPAEPVDHLSAFESSEPSE